MLVLVVVVVVVVVVGSGGDIGVVDDVDDFLPLVLS